MDLSPDMETLSSHKVDKNRKITTKSFDGIERFALCVIPNITVVFSTWHRGRHGA